MLMYSAAYSRASVGLCSASLWSASFAPSPFGLRSFKKLCRLGNRHGGVSGTSSLANRTLLILAPRTLGVSGSPRLPIQRFVVPLEVPLDPLVRSLRDAHSETTMVEALGSFKFTSAAGKLSLILFAQNRPRSPGHRSAVRLDLHYRNDVCPSAFGV